MVQAESDGLVHHWARGPRDLVRLYAPITYWEKRWEWQFCWFLETPDAIQGVPSQDLRDTVDYILNKDGRGWHRSGVHFSEVQDMAKAHVVLRLTDAPPPDWPQLSWGPGWAYYDSRLRKRVAQVSPRREYFDHRPSFAYLLNMELGGHCTFDMHDMYTEVHAPYRFGCMGGWTAAGANYGMPSDVEIECAKAWLQGQAVHVHDHGNVRIGAGAEGMPAPDEEEHDALP